jgi:pimeloyl-ACP methyl ester carboxylesterase
MKENAMQAKFKRIVVSDVSIGYYEQDGPGTPIVFLHGGGIDSATLSWSPAMAAMAGKRRCIAPDLPGYGESDWPDVPYGIAYYVGFLSAFLEHLGLDKVILVGISMGGGISLGYGLQHPENVERLVLVDAYGLADKAPMHRLSYLMVQMPWLSDLTYALVKGSRQMARSTLSGIICHPEMITDDLIDEVLKEIQRPGAGKAFAVFQKDEISWNGLKTVFMDRLKEISVPTLIVHGEKDSLVPLAAARQAAQSIPGAKLEVLEGCGHWAQRDAPEHFNQKLVDFLK